MLGVVVSVSSFVEGCGDGSSKKVAFTPGEAGEAGEPTGTAGTRAAGGNGGSAGTRGMTAGNGGTGMTDLGGAGSDNGGEAGADAGGSAGSAGSSAMGGGGTGGLASGGMSGSGGGVTCVGVDLQNDLNNCGACGKVCAGDQCSYGHCAKALAKGLNGANGVQVDATYAYFGTPTAGQISRVALAGGTPETIVTNALAGRTEMILLLGNQLYWTTNADQKVLTAPKAGGAATLVSGTENVPYGIASNGTDLFWANHSQVTNTIGHALISGLTAVNPIIGTPYVVNPTYVAADATYFYWGNAGNGTTTGGVYRAKLDGSAPTALVKNTGSVYGLAIDATNVYFTLNNNNQVAFVPKTSDVSVTPTQLGDATDTEPYQILVDGNDIYWLDGAAAVIRHRTKTGAAPETIASLRLNKIDQFLGLGANTYLAVDATHLYWADGGTQSQHGAIISLERN